MFPPFIIRRSEMDIKDINWRKTDNPYDQLRAVKSIMKNAKRNLAELDIIIDNMQDTIVSNLESKVANLEYELNKIDRSERLDEIIFGKEK